MFDVSTCKRDLKFRWRIEHRSVVQPHRDSCLLCLQNFIEAKILMESTLRTPTMSKYFLVFSLRFLQVLFGSYLISNIYSFEIVGVWEIMYFINTIFYEHFLKIYPLR